MTPAHWEVVRFIRQFYLEYKTSPAMRMLVKAIAKSLERRKRQFALFIRLFPKGPAKQATKIAGLPNLQMYLKKRVIGSYQEINGELLLKKEYVVLKFQA